jgi:Spy/CpxP family protein refolding chaperone
MRRFILLGILVLSLAGTALADRAFAQSRNGYGDFRDKLMEIKRGRLGPALGTDQRTVDQLLQIEQRYKPVRAQLKRDMNTEFQRLQQLMARPNPPEQEVKVTLDNLNRKRLEMLNLQQRQQEEEMAILTPVQQARYLMFLIGLRQQVTKEARTLRSAPYRGAPVAPATKPREIPVVRPTPE